MRFLVSHVGACSFCGKRDHEASAFASLAGRAHSICGMCLSLCLDITCEYDKREERAGLAAQLASFEPRREVDEEMVRKLRSGDVEGIINGLREQGHSNDDLEKIRAVVSRQSPRSCPVHVGRVDGTAEETCSFCDSVRVDVVKLVEGPGVTICDRCIDNASADVLRAMIAT
jgi:ClpX C4-type zinc finger